MKIDRQIYLQRLAYWGIIILYLSSCARPAAPEGGPLDEVAPQLLISESTPNFQTNFNERQIILEFDEYIEIRSANDQIVISPPFTNYLKYTVRGKRLEIDFPEDEALRDNATYQINFGSAIRDYTAGNVLENLTFVFATGDQLDSLEIKGKVIDAATGAASAETLVLLYDNLSDTAFFTEKPFYFAKTDESGNYSIKNIKEDTFNIFALTDDNLSLNYDKPTEKIAFYDSQIILPDTSIISFDLALFDEREVPRVQKFDQKEKRRAVLRFSEAPRDIVVGSDLGDLNFRYALESDSCEIWFETRVDSFSFYAAWEGVSDTLEWKSSKAKKGAIVFACENCGGNNKYFPRDTIELLFNIPIAKVDQSKLQQIDSLDQMRIDSVWFVEHELKIFGNFQDTGKYELQLLPGFVEDFLGSKSDSIKVEFEGKSEKVLGNIQLLVNNKEKDQQYIYELIDAKDKLIERYVVKEDSLLNFNRVLGGIYTLKVVEDLNKNGYWDSGDLKAKKTAEKIREFTLEELREGWDLETTIDFKNQFK